MNWLKWSLIASFTFFGFAVLLAIIYLITPVLISALLGVPVSCSSDIQTTPSNIANAITEPCQKLETFFGMAIIILTIISALPAFAANIIASLEILKSPTISGFKKLLWLVVFWVFIGPVAVVVYYFTDRKLIK